MRRRFPRAILPPDITDAGWEHGDASFEAALQRCQQVAVLLTETFHADTQIIMVTHGGFASVLLQTLLEISPAAPAWFAMDNCAITRLRIVPDQERWGWPPLFPPVGVEVVFMNDSSHLHPCPR